MPANFKPSVSEKRKSDENKLDEKVVLWKTTPPKGNEALLEQYRYEIWILAFKLYDYPEEDSGKHYDPNTFLDTLLEALNAYDPAQGPFSHYFSFLYARRQIDAYRKATKKDPSVKPDSARLEAPVGTQNDDNQATVGDMLSDDQIKYQPEKRVEFDGFLADLTAMVLNFSQRAGRANNEQRRRWQRLFYTEDMTYAIKMYDVPVFIHERDIFEAMNLEYLDYYMEAPCRTSNEVVNTSLKPYCQVVSGQSERRDPVPLPVPGDVSLAYLENCCGIHTGISTRSNQLSVYKKEKAKIF